MSLEALETKRAATKAEIQEIWKKVVETAEQYKKNHDEKNSQNSNITIYKFIEDTISDADYIAISKKDKLTKQLEKEIEKRKKQTRREVTKAASVLGYGEGPNFEKW